MTAASPKLVFEEVVKIREGRGGPTRPILQDLCLEVPEGRVTVIVGPSGGGKSTLLRLVNRLEELSGGRILLSGVDIGDIDPLQLRRRAGMVLQKPHMFEGTVLDNLEMAFRLRDLKPPAADSPQMRGALAGARLSPELLARDARALSVGQQQRVSMARTLLSRPELLLLDEPTSALDRPTALALIDLLRETSRAQSLTILMVTHDLQLAERVADRVAYLAEGRILEQGEPVELFRRPQTAALRKFLEEPQSPGV